MYHIIHFTVQLRCTERQIKTTPKELQKLAKDTNLDVEWSENSDSDGVLSCSGAIGQDELAKLVSAVIEKYKKRYVQVQVGGIKSSHAVKPVLEVVVPETTTPTETAVIDISPAIPESANISNILQPLKRKKKRSHRHSKKRSRSRQAYA